MTNKIKNKIVNIKSQGIVTIRSLRGRETNKKILKIIMGKLFIVKTK